MSAKISKTYLLPVIVDGKYHFIDGTGRIVLRDLKLEPTFFSKEGLCLVWREGKAGFINREGDCVTGFVFDTATSFSDGRALVCEGGVFNYLTATCHMLCKEGFQDAKEFRCQMAAAKTSRGLWGYLGTDGAIAFSIDRDFPFEFSDNLVFGNQLSEFRREYLNKTGDVEVVSPSGYISEAFSEGLSAVRSARSDHTVYGFMDKACEIVIPPKYKRVAKFSGGFCRVYRDGKAGFINAHGDEIISTSFDDARNFSNGLAAVLSGGKWGFIDHQGNSVVSNKFDAVAGFSDIYDGLFSRVIISGKSGFIDRCGDYLWEPSH